MSADSLIKAGSRVATLTRDVSTTLPENCNLAASQALRRQSAELRAKSRALLDCARASLDRADHAIRRSNRVCAHVAALRRRRRAVNANRT